MTIKAKHKDLKKKVKEVYNKNFFYTHNKVIEKKKVK